MLQRQYYSPERFTPGAVKTGETFSTDSGMGGTFLVAFAGYDRSGMSVWKVETPGWEKITMRIPQADIHQKIFILKRGTA